MRVRPALSLCKLPASLAAALLVVYVSASGCRQHPPSRIISVEELEHGQIVLPENAERHLVANPDAVDALCRPLNNRFGFLAIQDPADWEKLRQAVPGLSAAPDLSAGLVVGLVSWAGLPLDGEWPLSIEMARVSRGGGYLTALFRPGTYLPDRTAYLELAYLPDVETVLVVDVNGLRYTP
jgi:hypothetical protein